MHNALYCRNKEIAKLLIAKDADFNVTNNKGDTFLDYTYNWEHKDILGLLLQSWVDNKKSRQIR